MPTQLNHHVHPHRVPQTEMTRGWQSPITGLVPLPEDVAPQYPIELRLWRGLPLDHDGLVGAAAGHYVLRRCTGGLLRQHQSAENMEEITEENTFAMRKNYRKEYGSILEYLICNLILKLLTI